MSGIKIRLIILFPLLLLLSASVVAKGERGDFDYYVLALSWQSAFCEFNRHKTECKAQDSDDYSAVNFVLHGLWPNRLNDKKHRYSYCGVEADVVRQDRKKKWCDIAMKTTGSGLADWMPGAASCLHAHEWVKHGTCSSLSERAYFDLSGRLVKSFATSDFSGFIRRNIGSSVSRDVIFQQWRNSYGGKVSEPQLVCKKKDDRSFLVELRVKLSRNIESGAGYLESGYHKGRKSRGNCGKMIYLDRVGFE